MTFKIIEPEPKRVHIEVIDDAGVLHKCSTLEYAYCVYILYHNNKPIYVGMTSNIFNRIKTHKQNKFFDSYLVVAYDHDRSVCRRIEMACIAMLKSINNDLLNIDIPDAGSPINV